MGNLSSRLHGEDKQDTGNGLKRTLGEDSDDESSSSLMNTPQRKKLKSTAKYIYQTLFINGENSDITIKALNKDWPLHKIYLCQSSYFASMFSGSWRESTLKEITVDIPDQNIDEDAFKVALGSLYLDDVLIEPGRVVSILAAASLVQLDGLIQQCADIMSENISPKTIGTYHSAACAYGLQEVETNCVQWLERNLMVVQKPDLLLELSLDLFKKVINSPYLFVLQVEMDVYSLTKKYVFLKVNPSWHKDPKVLGKSADEFFQKFGPEEFLKSEKGQQYECLFKSLRFQYIINDHAACKQLQKDNIIPEEWLLPIYKQQWLRMLRVEQAKDNGPKEDSIPVELFELHSQRCGRIIPKEGEYCWRWTGFNFGVDLLVTYANKLLVVKRNNTTHQVSSSISMQSHRSIMIRIHVVSFDSQGRVLYEEKGNIENYSLSKDEERVLIGLNRHVKYPFQIAVNVLAVTPFSVNESNTEESERQQNLENN
ncbi:Germ cell-less protein-like 1 [Holothuria leucospilota]|uniref:Germ cell-less protein-like 1 n=1 Tax=Holothuria leucospilota TaxID=206669 RepID=A0A9Q1BEN2_HOLLE|nr:Germ cell-less protein-like 1 [Holothuria leucospilota]